MPEEVREPYHPLSLEDAIFHCKEEYIQKAGNPLTRNLGMEFLQLATWLEELKGLRNRYHMSA